ncbi:hypothetical protein ACJ73_03980, partial [Blastomyces percursus]
DSYRNTGKPRYTKGTTGGWDVATITQWNFSGFQVHPPTRIQRYNGKYSSSRQISFAHAQSTERYLPRKRFLSLPIELRSDIYFYLLIVDPSMDAPDDLNKPLDKVLCLQILHVNRQIREEALHILLHKNVWIHFQIRAITVPKHVSYHIYRLGDSGRYAQPHIPISGFLGEKVKQRLVVDVKITQRSEFVDKRRRDSQ